MGERGGINLYGLIHNDSINKFDLFGLSEDMAPAGPAPDHIKGDCQYYLWRKSDFEKRNEKTCYKPPKYYMEYGYKYCTEFRDITRPVLSSVGKKWLDSVLLKLQLYMEDHIDANDLIEYDDKAFTKMAFDIHSHVYWEAGFHKLSFLDKIFVASTPDFSEWSKSGTWNLTWKQALDMSIKEAEAYMAYPDDLREDAIQGMQDIEDMLEGNGPIDQWERQNGIQK